MIFVEVLLMDDFESRRFISNFVLTLKPDSLMCDKHKHKQRIQRRRVLIVRTFAGTKDLINNQLMPVPACVIYA